MKIQLGIWPFLFLIACYLGYGWKGVSLGIAFMGISLGALAMAVSSLRKKK